MIFLIYRAVVIFSNPGVALRICKPCKDFLVYITRPKHKSIYQVTLALWSPGQNKSCKWNESEFVEDRHPQHHLYVRPWLINTGSTMAQWVFFFKLSLTDRNVLVSFSLKVVFRVVHFMYCPLKQQNWWQAQDFLIKHVQSIRKKWFFWKLMYV